MLTLYFVLYLLAFICFVVAALLGRPNPAHDTASWTPSLVPAGFALVDLVWLLQTLHRL